jgi:hypothetical protein
LRKDKPAWQDVETPVAKAVGTVDAAILNHPGQTAIRTAFKRAQRLRLHFCYIENFAFFVKFRNHQRIKL